MSNFSSNLLDITFNSIDDYSDAIKEFDLEAIQASAGIYINHHQIVDLPKIQLGLRSMSCATIHNGVLLQDAFYIVIPKENLQTYVNGKIVGLSQFFIIKPNEEVSTVFAADFSATIMCIPVTSLAEYIDEQSLMLLNQYSELLRHEAVAPKNINTLNAKLNSIICFIVKNHQVLSNQSLEDAQESVFALLNEFLFSMLEQKGTIKTNRNNHYEIVKRAFSYIKGKEQINITIPELTNVCFCSTRNLEYAFKSIVKMTPKQFLIKRRLNLIHNMLNQNPTILIRDIVKSFGIINIGRFSNDYYQMFGQYPRETLRKR